MGMPSSIWTAILEIQGDPGRVEDLVARRYRGPIYDFARHQGLRAEDAEDVAQEVFLRVCRREFLEKADRSRGRFRSLLLAVTRHVIADVRGRGRRALPLGDIEIPENCPPDAEFNRLWAANLMASARERIGDEPALRLQLAGRSYREIAAELGMSEFDVANALHRARVRLRDEIERRIREYSSGDDVRAEIAELLEYL